MSEMIPLEERLRLIKALSDKISPHTLSNEKKSVMFVQFFAKIKPKTNDKVRTLIECYCTCIFHTIYNKLMLK